MGKLVQLYPTFRQKEIWIRSHCVPGEGVGGGVEATAKMVGGMRDCVGVGAMEKEGNTLSRAGLEGPKQSESAKLSEEQLRNTGQSSGKLSYSGSHLVLVNSHRFLHGFKVISWPWKYAQNGR